MAASDTLRTARATSRRRREHEIVGATRALFDARGLQDAPIEDIAKAVGINKALIYRHFASKEELFVLTVTRYLDELVGRLDAVGTALEPVARMREISERFTTFCLRYPAFLDCALSLMRRPAPELRERVSDAVWLRLGQAMAACLASSSATIADGIAAGAFRGDIDPDLAANHLYTQTLGAMHLARIGVGVREATPGFPGVFPIDPEQVRRACVESAMAYLLAAP